MKLIRLFILMSLMLPSMAAKAGHNFGGEITWKDLGGGKYRIIAKIYRDCRGIVQATPEFGCFATSQSGSSCGSDTLTGFTRTAIVNASTACKWTANPCSPANTTNSGEGLEIHVYERIVDMNKAPLNKYYGKSSCSIIGFYLYQCCRPSAINSIPTNTNMYITCSMNIANLQKCKSQVNSSPTWNRNFPAFNCCNQAYYVNPGLTDSNEFDRFNFQLVAPLQGLPNNPVSYTSLFTAQYPVTPYCVPPTTIKCTAQPEANPPRGTWIDSVTGDFIYTPTKCDEVTPIAMQATEYRRDSTGNWVWIGKTSREFVISVRDDCGYNKVPLITGNLNPTVCAGDKICIKYKIYDQTFTPYQSKRDTVSVSWTSPIKNAQITVTSDTGENVKNVEICWQTSKADIRDYPYVFSLEGRDGHCDKQGVASRGISILVKDNDTAGFTYSFGKCNTLRVDGYTGKIANKFGGTTYIWYLQDTSTKKMITSGNLKKDTFTMLNKGVYALTMWASNNYVCMPEVKKIITVKTEKPTTYLGKDTSVCVGNSINLKSKESNVSAPITYLWKLTDSSGTANSASSSVALQVKRNTSVILKITDSNNCVATDTLQIKTLLLPAVSWTASNLNNRCYSEGNLSLDQFVKYPTAGMRKNGNYRIWGSNSKNLVDSISPLIHELNVKKINNSVDLQSGKSISDQITIWFQDSNGCINTAKTSIKINGNPIIALDSWQYCQDLGAVSMDNSVVKPKVKFGTRQEWKALSGPAGVDTSKILTDKSGGSGTDWWFNFGNSSENFYAGNYRMKFKVKDLVTGCFTEDSTQITIVAEPALTAKSALFCDGYKNNDLLNIFLTDGKEPNAAESNFKIKAYNLDTNSSAFGNTKILNGRYLSSDAKTGIWTIYCNNQATGCPTSSVFDVTVKPSPKASFTTTPSDTANFNSPSFTTKNTSSISPAGSLSYVWVYDWSNGQINSNAFEPVITYPAANVSYLVKLIAISQDGCQDTFSKRLVIGAGNAGVQDLKSIPPYKINKQFIFSAENAELMQIWVYDASGKLIQTNSLNSGIILNPGIYYYVLKLKVNHSLDVYASGRKVILPE